MHFENLIHERDYSPMVLIPAGHFTMGLPSTDFLAEKHEQPERQVYLSAYWMDIYPVTNARFATFMAEGGYDDAKWWDIAGWQWLRQHGHRQPLMWDEPGWDGPDQPAAGVCWYEADAYARWAGRRLPTDAEWEKAARGTDGRRYPWGNDWPTANLANFANVVGRTTPVGLYPQGVSPYGCHDMAGNVNNWTSDWYSESPHRACNDADLFDGMEISDVAKACLFQFVRREKVDRGGGYATSRACQEVLGCTRKTHWTPATRASWNGFRTAMDAKDGEGTGFKIS